MRKLSAFWVALLLLVATTWCVAPRAAAADSAPINRYHVAVQLTQDGHAEVTIDMEMDFSVVRGRGPYLTFPTRQDDGQNTNEQYAFDYSDFSVSSATGARTDQHLSEEDGALMLRIGDEDIFNTTAQQYTISYRVFGFVASEHPRSGLDEFSWNPIGTSWESDFSDIEVKITGPAAVTRSGCFHGPSYGTECAANTAGNTVTVTLDSLPAYHGLQVVAGFPALTFGGVKQVKVMRPTPANMFRLTPATGAVTGGGLLAAIAALVLVRRRHARDEVYLGLTPGLVPAGGETGMVGAARGKAPVTVQFHPPKGATPGEIGTLIDATADNVDVSATIVDLAVRGYLRIESHKGQQEGREFSLHALPRPAGEKLRGYEEKLLANLFKGAQVRTSNELRKESFAKVLPEARSGLYQAVVAKRWFKSHPTYAQLTPIIAGGALILGGILLALLAASVGWGLIGLPLLVLGIGLIAMSGKFRKRSALGSAMLSQARGFELYLTTAEKETLRFEEGHDIFSKYLPYAIVFGVADRWANLFAQLGQEGYYLADTSWYSGSDLLHGYVFINSLHNLTHSMSETMSAAQTAAMTQSTGSSSGFSGFSGGGGFGGGGGGSW